MDVLTMLPALTLMEVMSVHVILGSLEMASPVQVNQLYIPIRFCVSEPLSFFRHTHLHFIERT